MIGIFIDNQLVDVKIQTINFQIQSHPSAGFRHRGGLEEERAERQRWNEKEQKKIMDSVRGKSN